MNHVWQTNARINVKGSAAGQATVALMAYASPREWAAKATANVHGLRLAWVEIVWIIGAKMCFVLQTPVVLMVNVFKYAQIMNNVGKEDSATWISVSMLVLLFFAPLA